MNETTDDWKSTLISEMITFTCHPVPADDIGWRFRFGSLSRRESQRTRKQLQLSASSISFNSNKIIIIAMHALNNWCRSIEIDSKGSNWRLRSCEWNFGSGSGYIALSSRLLHTHARAPHSWNDDQSGGTEKRKTGLANSIPTFIDVLSYQKINISHVCVQLASSRQHTHTHDAHGSLIHYHHILSICIECPAEW